MNAPRPNRPVPTFSEAERAAYVQQLNNRLRYFDEDPGPAPCSTCRQPIEPHNHVSGRWIRATAHPSWQFCVFALGRALEQLQHRGKQTTRVRRMPNGASLTDEQIEALSDAIDDERLKAECWDALWENAQPPTGIGRESSTLQSFERENCIIRQRMGTIRDRLTNSDVDDG